MTGKVVRPGLRLRPPMSNRQQKAVALLKRKRQQVQRQRRDVFRKTALMRCATFNGLGRPFESSRR